MTVVTIHVAVNYSRFQLTWSVGNQIKSIRYSNLFYLLALTV